MSVVIHDRTESARGCGYRQGGGMYLVGGGAMMPCGLLPWPLSSCPTCGGGMKPSRGWTWIEPAKLFDTTNLTCMSKFCSELCPMRDMPERAGLLWIAPGFYKTPADFIREGVDMGFSRRISQIPKDFVAGETRVFFAHKQAMPCTACDPITPDVECHVCGGTGVQAGIFSSFVPKDIEYVVTGKESERKLKRIAKRGITLVRVKRINSDGAEVDQRGKPV